MLDPALKDFLREDHELLRFVAGLGHFTRTQDEHPAPDHLGVTVGDRDAIEYAFGRYVYGLDDALSLPAGTDSQRAVLDRLRAGDHWTLPGAGHPVFDH